MAKDQKTQKLKAVFLCVGIKEARGLGNYSDVVTINEYLSKST
jgi:hypothetical protein